ncbi:MAG: hypothetical protein WAV76_12140 [Bacteroidota bacterium]
MTQALRLAALLLVIQVSSACAQCPSFPVDTARVREELVIEYTTFRDAFMRNTPQAWINALDSSFTLTLFSGAVMPKDWVENYVRTNAAQFHIRTLQMEIQSITVQADTATATVRQTSNRDFTDEHGVLHRLEVSARQIETWVCTTTGWRIRHVKEDSLLYLRRDSR